LAFQPRRGIAHTPGDFGIDYDDLTLETSDGERIGAWWVPAARARRGHVLYAHGNAGNVGDRIPVIALLAQAGLDVLAFDYRGYGASTGRPDEHGTYRDARAALAALLARPEVDPKKVVYLGKSLGGAVVLELAQHHRPAGLVLMSTFTSFRDAAAAVVPVLPRLLVPDAYPSIDRIRRSDVPVSIMHGEDDRLLPVRMAHELHAAARGPKTLATFPGAGHNDIILRQGAAWARTVAEFTADVENSAGGTRADHIL
jgi:fermentation-respiration switch protein FrsA (DUF1100 family)